MVFCDTHDHRNSLIEKSTGIGSPPECSGALFAGSLEEDEEIRPLRDVGIWCNLMRPRKIESGRGFVACRSKFLRLTSAYLGDFSLKAV